MRRQINSFYVEVCGTKEISGLTKKPLDMPENVVEPEAKNHTAVQSIRAVMMEFLREVRDGSIIVITEKDFGKIKMASKSVCESIFLIGIVHGIVSAMPRSDLSQNQIKIILHFPADTPHSSGLLESALLLLGAIADLEDEKRNQELEWLAKVTLGHVEVE